MDLDPDMRGTAADGQLLARVYRYCFALACGDEAVAQAATVEALGAQPPADGPDPAALFALARAAVKAALPRTTSPAAGPLFAARPLLEEHHWSLLALVLPEYADRPRHRQVDFATVAAALGKKVDVTRKAVDRLVESGGYLDVAMFTADAAAAGGGDCPDLAAVVTGAKRLRPSVRKAVAAHLPACAACTAARQARPPVLAVLNAAPIPVVPADLVTEHSGRCAVPVHAAPADCAGQDAATQPPAATDHCGPVAGDRTEHRDRTAAGDRTADRDGTADRGTPGALPPEDADEDDTAPQSAASRDFDGPAGDDDDTDITAELLLAAAPEPQAAEDRAPAIVYYAVPAVGAGVRPPLLRRPLVLLTIVVVLLAAAVVAGVFGLRSSAPAGGSDAADVSTVAVPAAVAPRPVLSAPGVGVTDSPGATRTPAASGHAKASGSTSALPAASGSAGLVAPLAPAGDRLMEVLPLMAKAPGCPGQTFGGSCYSIQPFTLPLSVNVPAGFDEARLADTLLWTVRAQTVLGPVAFQGRGNHARVTVTDGGQATPPTVWTMQAALTVGGQTYLSNEVTLRVYATT